eukprot:TCALIF_04939-PA protein Name:"Similar to Bag6 Large proline-rich protein bag6 (Xenopus tropicalis)" AED:0.07 eAED:0.07 QI:0/0.5/0.33/0.66/1/1/3/304/1268
MTICNNPLTSNILLFRIVPVDGSDPLANGPPRNTTPATGTRHAIHLHGPQLSPFVRPLMPMGHGASMAQASPRVRLHLVKEMLRRAKLVVDRLNNPQASESDAASRRSSPARESDESPRNIRSGFPSMSFEDLASGSDHEDGAQGGPSLNGASASVHITAASPEGESVPVGHLPPGMAEAIGGLVHRAMASHMQPPPGVEAVPHGQAVAMSFRLDESGQMVPADANSAQLLSRINGQAAVGPRGNATPGNSNDNVDRRRPRSTNPATTPDAMDTATQSDADTGSAAGASGANGTTNDAPGPNQGPPGSLEPASLSDMADAMSEYQAVHQQLQTHWDRLNELLRDNNGTLDEESHHQFYQVTHAMHYLSHALHALSDMNLHNSRLTQRIVRARPIVIQTSTTATVPTVVQVSESPARRSNGTAPASTSTTRSSTSTSTTATATTSSSAASASTASATPRIPGNFAFRPDNPMPFMSQGDPSAMVSAAINAAVNESASQLGAGIALGVTPIVVGIEMGPEIVVSSSAGPAISGEANLGLGGPQPRGAGFPTQNIIQGLLQGAMSSGANAASTPSGTTAGSSTSATNGPNANNAQDSQARGNTTTNPTTSTRTRSSPHYHYTPRIQGGIRYGSIAFDPFLPCNSHHIQSSSSRRRIRHPAGLTPQRPRSASVPPRRPENNQRTRSSSHQRATTNSSPQMNRRGTGMTLSPERLQQMAVGAVAAQNYLTHQREHQRHMFRHYTQHGAAVASAPATPPRPSAPPAEPSLQRLQQDMLNSLASGEGTVDETNALMLIQGVYGQVMGGMFGQETSTIGEYLNNLPDYNYVEGESLISDLSMTIAREITFSDLIQFVMGTPNASLNRVQGPLRQFLTRVLSQRLPGRQSQSNGDTPTNLSPSEVREATLRFCDEIFPEFEEMTQDVNVREDVNFPETLHEFFSQSMVPMINFILTSSGEEFSQNVTERITHLGEELFTLCRQCFTDDLASVERLIDARIGSLSRNVGPILQQWSMSTSMGHIRNFLARVNLPDSEVVHYVVSPSQVETRVAARNERRQQEHSQAPANDLDSDGNDEDQFVTPRSSGSPVSMDVDEPVAGSSTSSSPKKDEDVEIQFAVPEPIDESQLRFPSSLLSTPGMGPDMLIGSEPWHRAVPQDWVPVIARDGQQTRNLPQQQQPFSDAYLSTQPAKRRKLASHEKMEGSVSTVVGSTVRNAIQNAGVQPTSSIETVIREVSNHHDVTQAVTEETQRALRRSLRSNPDFSKERFPNAERLLKK